MGIFSNRMRYIQELKIDGKEVKDQKDNDEDFKLGTEEEPPVEDNPPTDVDNDKTEDEEDYNIPDDDTEENSENPEDNPEGNLEDNPNDETGNDEDFSMGDSDNPDDNTEGNPENPEDNPNDGTENTTGGKSEVQELEDKLFTDLSPEQMTIKHIELKQQYIDIFDAISDIVSRVNKITKTTDNSSVIEFVSNKMIELKDLVHFYLNNTYTTKTYIENTMNYQQYIVILNTINKMLKEIIPKTGKTN